jgi:hypothetical protein
MPAWRSDPVHAAWAPQAFWSSVPYLDPSCGDHKIIWELNRHQHWLTLGRAFWLTGDTRYRDRCLAELASWLADNPPLIGINWASMLELGLRSISWLWALNFFAAPVSRDATPWIVDLLIALDRQLLQIERNLSYYFSPNTHLLGEALALYVAGRSLPELKASERRAQLGRRVLVAEINRQIAHDGGHCERSTHYQRYALDFYSLALIVAKITDDPAATDFEHVVARLASAARMLCDDQGRLPLIGDDDGGQLSPILGRRPEDIRDSLAVAAALTGRQDLAVGRPPEEAYWLLAHPALSSLLEQSLSAPPSATPRSTALSETGYYISRSAAGDHIVIDGGPHGFKNAGHAHADALSLTMTVGGVPMLIDPGTACYTINPSLRDRMRSTALHNTLELNHRSQSSPNGPFSWARTANAHVLRWRNNQAFDYFVGAHDGYRPAEHRRHVLVLHGDLVVVADLVSGEGVHHAAVHWHIDQRWMVRRSSAQRFDVTSGPQQCQLVIPSAIAERFVGDDYTGLGWCASVYGRVDQCTTIQARAVSEAPLWIVSVFGLDPNNAVQTVELNAIEDRGGVLSHATAFRIVRERSVDQVLIAEPTAGVSGAIWSANGVETDAHLVFSRTSDSRIVQVAIVDGSLVRAARGEPLLELSGFVSDLHVDTLCAA